VVRLGDDVTQFFRQKILKSGLPLPEEQALLQLRKHVGAPLTDFRRWLLKSGVGVEKVCA
jgi:hypothetical protein